jgi:hypothetical protein
VNHYNDLETGATCTTIKPQLRASAYGYIPGRLRGKKRSILYGSIAGEAVRCRFVTRMCIRESD